MKRVCGLFGSCCAAAVLVVGCQKLSEGTAITARQLAPETTGSSTPVTTSTTEVPGVMQTLRETIPPNAFVCFPQPSDTGTATTATVADPAAPRLTVTVPDGWTSQPGTGDVALTLAGPDGLSGVVTIAATTLGPADAFDKYADDVAVKAALSSINLRPAEFCGYSSQELFGTLSDSPADVVEFADRITHIWTNTKTYLVAIQMQGPRGAPGFEDARTVLMSDFAIVIP